MKALTEAYEVLPKRLLVALAAMAWVPYYLLSAAASALATV